MRKTFLSISVAASMIVSSTGHCVPAIALDAASPAVAAEGVAALHLLGKANALEECSTKLGLSLRPWDGAAFRDYDWVHGPGKPTAFRAQFAGHPEIDRVVLSFWDWHGRVVARRQFGRGIVDEIVNVNVDGFGTWLMTLDAYEAKRLRSRLLRGFSVVPDARSARNLWHQRNDYFIGSCCFPRRYYRWSPWFYRDQAPAPNLKPGNAVDRVVKLAARCGFTVLRTEYFGRPVDKPTWKADWEIQDEVVDVFRKHGMGMDLKVQLFPACFEGDTLTRKDFEFGRWAEDLDYLIEHLIHPEDSVVSLVELGNEPAHHEFWAGTREQYQWLVEYGTKAIHAARPELPVVHGGTCPPGADLAMQKRENPEEYERAKRQQAAWYRAFYREMAPEAQWWAYHCHGALSDDMMSWRQEERTALAAIGCSDVPFVQTEGGSCAWRPDREVTTWVEVMQKILYSWAAGEKGWLQYNLAFHAGRSRYADRNGWSVLHGHTLSPRFLYGAIAAMVHTMAGCTRDAVLLQEHTDGQLTLLTAFNHPQGKLLAGFSQAGPNPVQLTTDARQIRRVDPMGNGTDLPPAEQVTIELDREPIFILLMGATRIGHRAK